MYKRYSSDEAYEIHPFPEDVDVPHAPVRVLCPKWLPCTSEQFGITVDGMHILQRTPVGYFYPAAFKDNHLESFQKCVSSIMQQIHKPEVKEEWDLFSKKYPNFSDSRQFLRDTKTPFHIPLLAGLFRNMVAAERIEVKQSPCSVQVGNMVETVETPIEIRTVGVTPAVKWSSKSSGTIAGRNGVPLPLPPWIPIANDEEKELFLSEELNAKQKVEQFYQTPLYTYKAYDAACKNIQEIKARISSRKLEHLAITLKLGAYSNLKRQQLIEM